jgi:uncharacterized coiled-coil protein SlyX
MSTLTLPRAQIPLTVGGDRMSPEFYRWAYDVTIRAGGVTGEGTDELSAAMFEDAGIEELKMQVYQLTDELRSFPPNIHWPDPEVDSQQARIEALEAQVAELTKIIDSILAGPSL